MMEERNRTMQLITRTILNHATHQSAASIVSKPSSSTTVLPFAGALFWSPARVLMTSRTIIISSNTKSTIAYQLRSTTRRHQRQPWLHCSNKEYELFNKPLCSHYRKVAPTYISSIFPRHYRAYCVSIVFTRRRLGTVWPCAKGYFHKIKIHCAIENLIVWI